MPNPEKKQLMSSMFILSKVKDDFNTLSEDHIKQFGEKVPLIRLACTLPLVLDDRFDREGDQGFLKEVLANLIYYQIKSTSKTLEECIQELTEKYKELFGDL